jgi:hypothetical protein
MAANDGEKSEKVTDQNSQAQHVDRQERRRDQGGGWSNAVRIVVGAVTVAISGICGVLLRLWPQPYNIIAGVMATVSFVSGAAFEIHTIWPHHGRRIAIVGIIASMAISFFVVVSTRNLSSRNRPAMPAPFHVTLGAPIYCPKASLGKMTRLAVVYPRSKPRMISQVNLLLFVTVENNQAVPSTIVAYSLEVLPKRHDGAPLKLCPVTLMGGQAFSLLDQFRAIPLNLENGLEAELLTKPEIKAHGTVSGWTLWQCPPQGDCAMNLGGLRMTVTDASGVHDSTLLRSVGTMAIELQPSILRPGTPTQMPQGLAPWNQCR